MTYRDDVLDSVATRLLERRLGRPLRVGIDGVCGAGKSTFADELCARIEAGGGAAIRLDSDGFHNIKAIRYRQGRDSARGYYEDAYDFDALAERVLTPLGTGTLTYATKVHDLESDAVITDAYAEAPRNAVLVFDCTFLQRGRLRELWDEVIFLSVPLDTAQSRGVARDETRMGGKAAARAAYTARYMAACRIYLDEEDPEVRASVLIDHADVHAPRVVRW